MALVAGSRARRLGWVLSRKGFLLGACVQCGDRVQAPYKTPEDHLGRPVCAACTHDLLMAHWPRPVQPWHELGANAPMWVVDAERTHIGLGEG